MMTDYGERYRVLGALCYYLLRGSLATHRRRCAIEQGVRETDPDRCQHDWDLAMQWCRKCGLGKKDLFND